MLQESLAGATIDRVHGIVNGTTNFILTEMARTGATFADALAEAQRLGYAEADPTEDVNGKDAAAKMAILARLAFETPVHLDQVLYEGIEQIQPDDLEYARDLGLGLKLIGTAERVDGRALGTRAPGLPVPRAPARVGQRPVQRGHGRVRGDHRDHDVGPGRGRPQTASAVLGDVISAMIPPASTPPAIESLRIVADVSSAFYLYLEVADEPGVLARVADVLARAGRVGQIGGAEGPGRPGAAGDGRPPGAGVAVLRGDGGDRGAVGDASAPTSHQGDRRRVCVTRTLHFEYTHVT